MLCQIDVSTSHFKSTSITAVSTTSRQQAQASILRMCLITARRLGSADTLQVSRTHLMRKLPCHQRRNEAGLAHLLFEKRERVVEIIDKDFVTREQSGCSQRHM